MDRAVAPLRHPTKFVDEPARKEHLRLPYRLFHLAESDQLDRGEAFLHIGGAWEEAHGGPEHQKLSRRPVQEASG